MYTVLCLFYVHVAKTWKQPNYPSIEGWKRRCYTYVQWNTATTWRDLENIMPQLFTFSFISLVLRNMLAKILQHGISEILLSMFSTRTSMVSQFIFKSFYPFWVYFAVWCKLVVYYLQFFCIYQSSSPNTIYWRN